MRRILATCIALTCVLATPVAASASTSASGLPPVSQVTLTRTTSTSLVLAWALPAGATSTVIRVLPGRAAPRRESDGASAGRFRRGLTTATITSLRPGTRYSLALFAVYGKGRVSRRAVIGATTAPAPVAGLAAYASGRNTLLRWTVPHSPAAYQVVVRVAAGNAAPATPAAGRGVRLAARRAGAVVLTGLARHTRFAVSVFTLDRSRRVSTPAVTRFTTLPDPDKDGMVVGRVTDSAGQPLSGADVESFAGPDGYHHPTTVVTKGDGRFAIVARSDSVSLIVGGSDALGGDADQTGYVSTVRDVDVTVGGTTDIGDVPLAAGAAITGRVVNRSDDPVSGADVFPVPVEPYVHTDELSASYFYEVLSTRPGTPASGTFTLRGIDASGPVRLCPSRADIDGFCARRPLVLHPGVTTMAPDLVYVAPATTSTGVVTGHVRFRGHPVSGANVSLESEGPVFGYGSAVTDASGAYRITGVAAARYLACTETPSTARPALASGYDDTCSRSFVVGSHTHATVDITLTAGAALDGTVTGPRGRPVADAQVGVGTYEDDGDGEQFDEEVDAVTDRFGHYRITGLDGDPVEVCVTSPSDPTPALPTGVQSGCAAGGRNISPTLGAVRTGVDVQRPAGGAVHGTVRTTAGDPVQGAVVIAQSKAKSDEDEFELSNPVTTDAAGRFTLAGLSPGSYFFCTGPDIEDASDESACTTAAVKVVAGRSSSTAVVLPAPSAIHVDVRDAAGMPVAGADAVALGVCAEFDESCDDHVPLFNPDVPVEVDASDVTAPDGGVDLTDLDPGRYAVCVLTYYATTASGGSATGYADRCTGPVADVTVTRGHTTTVSVQLADGGAVSGTVSDSTGHPLQGAIPLVSASTVTDQPGYDRDEYAGPDPFDPGPVDGPGYDDASDALGHYSVIGIQPGTRSVCFVATQVSGGSSHGGYRDRCVGGAAGSQAGGTGAVVTVDTTTTGVDVTLTDAAAISGIVHTPRHTVYTGAQVSVLRPKTDDVVAETETGVDGTWQLTGLAAGTYVVCVAGQHSAQCWHNVAWHPTDENQQAPDKATPVTLTAGRLLTGIDAVVS